MSSPVFYSEEAIRTRHGVRSVLVMTPRASFRVGRMHLLELRGPLSVGLVDRDCLRALEHHPSCQVALFRGASDNGAGSFRFEEGLSDADSAELAKLLLRSMLPTFRHLLTKGVFAQVHCDWGPCETSAFRAAAETMAREVGDAARGASPERVAEARIQVWMLKHVVFFFGLGADRMLRDVLPEKLPMLEQRLPRIREMLSQLQKPDADLDENALSGGAFSSSTFRAAPPSKHDPSKPE